MLDWKRFEGTLTGTASNGKDALELIELSPPDVIISDIKMPVMDGLELAKEIFSRNWEIKLILLSAHGEFTYAQKAIQYGVTDYILKPVTRQKLQDRSGKTNHQTDFQCIPYQWDSNIDTFFESGCPVYLSHFHNILWNSSNCSHKQYQIISDKLPDYRYCYREHGDLRIDHLIFYNK